MNDRPELPTPFLENSYLKGPEVTPSLVRSLKSLTGGIGQVELPMMFAIGPVPAKQGQVEVDCTRDELMRGGAVGVPISDRSRCVALDCSRHKRFGRWVLWVARLQPISVETPLPFSQGVVMTTGGGALAERRTWTEGECCVGESEMFFGDHSCTSLEKLHSQGRYMPVQLAMLSR